MDYLEGDYSLRYYIHLVFQIPLHYIAKPPFHKGLGQVLGHRYISLASLDLAHLNDLEYKLVPSIGCHIRSNQPELWTHSQNETNNLLHRILDLRFERYFL